MDEIFDEPPSQVIQTFPIDSLEPKDRDDFQKLFSVLKQYLY